MKIGKENKLYIHIKERVEAYGGQRFRSKMFAMRHQEWDESGEGKQREKEGAKGSKGNKSSLFLDVHSIRLLALLCNMHEIRLIWWKVY